MRLFIKSFFISSGWVSSDLSPDISLLTLTLCLTAQKNKKNIRKIEKIDHKGRKKNRKKDKKKIKKDKK